MLTEATTVLGIERNFVEIFENEAETTKSHKTNDFYVKLNISLD